MKKISIMILVLVVAMASCKKTPEVNLKYVDVERDLVTVGMTTANIQCDYDYIATLKKAYLFYGEGTDESDFTSAEMRVVQNTLYVELMGLKSNTTYNYYYEFHNGFNSMRTALKSFKTEASPGDVTLPTVITAVVTEITTNSAKGGGEVTHDGGAEVTERGICWSTNANPTLEDSHVAAGSGMGVFTAAMSGLEANTTYHVRAYAINEAGTAYGLDKVFVTIGGGGTGGVPEGAIDGLFSVSPTHKVYFSQGNLQYQASTNTWRFAENQWDFVGGVDFQTGIEWGNVFDNNIKCDNSLISESYQGWIDLFGFGTNGVNNGFICYQPWSTGNNTFDYYCYNLYENSGIADWGYNSISNGGNQPSIWRTLSHDEWRYLLNRPTVSGISYALARVNGIDGLILVPDDWDCSYYNLNNCNGGNGIVVSAFSDNIISINEWNSYIEPHGAAFLPAAGNRRRTLYSNQGTLIVGSGGFYYSSNASDNMSISIIFENNNVASDLYSGRDAGFSVRLAHDATAEHPIHKPVVITSEVSTITSNSACCSGEVTYDGGAEVTERGICWGTNVNPSMEDSHVAAGAGVGLFTATISGLVANTTYHVRAYATNEAGTAYGLDKEFVTIGGGGTGGVPEGAIDGLFSVSRTQKVYFSQGNLQYQASTNTWRFAENQWDFVGDGVHGNVEENGVKCNNELISSTYDGWIDLFGWGTSGYNHGAVCYQPWSSTTNYVDYCAYGYTTYPDMFNLNDQTGRADWGANAISNGGNSPGIWRTLTHDELDFLIYVRIHEFNLNYTFVKAQIDGINGIILFPDNWDCSYFSFNDTNPEGDFDSNIINASQWDILKQYGVVFLPAAGRRFGETVNDVMSYGYTWSASYVNSPVDYTHAHSMYFTNRYYSTGFENPRYTGCSVRLVQDTNP